MKNLLKFCGLAALMLIIGCEDNSKSPLFDAENGAFVLVEIETTVIDVTDIENSTYGGILYAPSDNVASHDFQVRRVSGGVASEFAPVYSTSTFPAEFRIGATEIAAALGLQISDILPGDRFDFVGTTTGLNGEIVTFDELSPNTQAETGQKQAYNLVTFVSCPFVQADAVGQYNIVNSDGFVLNGQTEFPVEAGSGPNELEMINPFGGTEMFDITVTVSDSGIANVDNEFAFDTGEQCCGGFEDTRVSGDGFVFSCSGTITLSLDTRITQVGTGAQFSFGAPINFVAQKQP